MQRELKYVDMSVVNRALGLLEGVALFGPDNYAAVIANVAHMVESAITEVGKE